MSIICTAFATVNLIQMGMTDNKNNTEYSEYNKKAELGKIDSAQAEKAFTVI